MTDRLAELHQGRSLPTQGSADVDDIETGLIADQDAVLAKFNREAEAIDKVYAWADKSIRAVNDSLSDPESLPTIGEKLDVIEKKLDAVRKRLKRIAGENKEFAAQKSGVPSSLRIRVSRYTKLGKDFMAVTSQLESSREAHKKVATKRMKHDILRANPNASEAHVDRALENGTGIDTFLQTDNSNLRYQVEDLQSRNRDIQKLSKNIVDLHQMFTDMSILVEGQQELINDIEYNVKEVKADTKKAAEELVVARKHQKSARKKKACICILVIVIIIGIAAAILIPIALKNGWFSGGSSNSEPTPNPSPSRSAGSTRNHKFGNPAPEHFKARWYE